MTINRELWDIKEVTSFPKWPCPSCQGGHLSQTKADNSKAIKQETGESLKYHGDQDWEPWWRRERFATIMVCDVCAEVVVVSGDCFYDERYGFDFHTQRETREYISEFAPIGIYPAPPIFPIPNGCSDAVKSELSKSFSQFWTDGSACANNMRCAVEALMDDQKMRKKRLITQTQKYHKLVLHDRITEFKAKNPEAAVFLLAVKWLGNNGSHTATNEFSKAELLDGFEVLETAIELIYVKDAKRISDLAKAMIANKGKPATK